MTYDLFTCRKCKECKSHGTYYPTKQIPENWMCVDCAKKLRGEIKKVKAIYEEEK